MEAIKRYEITIELYKHFNEVILKGTAFLYSLIAGLVVFYLTNQNVENIIILKYLAGLATLISFLLFWFSSSLIKNVELEITNLANELEIEFYPTADPLYYFLKINAIGMLVILGLGVKFLT